MTTLVCLETVSRRSFASALEWPGWCRSGRSEEDAVTTLAAYCGRYELVSKKAGIRFPIEPAEQFEVVERLSGNATTQFGAPAIAADYERRAVDRAEAKRLAALVNASWQVFAAVLAGAPVELRKGPRGGGRDRDQIAAHVVEAEITYARKLGIRLGHDIDEVRSAILERLGTPSGGGTHDEKEWLPRYAARRIAWHVLDHAWEIEDKS